MERDRSVLDTTKAIPDKAKRIFTIVFSSLALLLASPTYAQDTDSLGVPQQDSISVPKKIKTSGSITLESINHAPLMGRLFGGYGAQISGYGQLSIVKSNTDFFIYQTINSIYPKNGPNYSNVGIRQKIPIAALPNLNRNIQAQVFLTQNIGTKEVFIDYVDKGGLIGTTSMEYEVDKKHARWLRKTFFVYGSHTGEFEGAVGTGYRRTHKNRYIKPAIRSNYQVANNPRNPSATLGISLGSPSIDIKGKVSVQPHFHAYKNIINGKDHPGLRDGVGIQFIVQSK